MRTGRDGLGDVARIADAAIGDERDAGPLEGLGDVRDGRDLRHADTADDPRRADRARTDADLDAVDAGLDERPRRLGRGDVATDDLDVGVVLLDPGDLIEDTLRVAMRRIDDDDVDAGLDEGRGALIGGRADRGADTQTAVFVLAGLRLVGRLLDVLDRDHATQAEIVVDDEDLLDAVLVEQAQDLLPVGPLLDRHEPFLRRHDTRDGLIEAGLETQIAVGHDADETLALDDRHTRDVVRPRQFDDLADARRRRDRDRRRDDAALELLDGANGRGLVLGRHVLVDDAHAALLGQGDGQAGLGHGVHGRREQRNIEADLACQPGLQPDLARHDRRVGRYEEDVVEGQRLFANPHKH